MNPTSNLPEGAIYVAVSNGYYDAAGNQGTAASATFTVDATGPGAPTFSPLNSATVTNAGRNITLTFAEAVKKDNSNADFADEDLSSILTLRQTNSSGTAIGYAASINGGKTVITLNPTSNLPEGAIYVAVTNGYYDAAGNQGTAASATFTLDATGPGAPTFSPQGGATVTNAGRNITLTFAEAVKKDGSNADFADGDLSSILTLRQTNSSGTAIGYAASINGGKTVITLNPTSNLPEGAIYVAVTNGYYDAAGNQGTAASATFTLDATVPGAPTDFIVKPGDGGLSLSWIAPSGTVTGYDVHYTSAPASGNGAVANDATASGSDASAAWVAVTRSGTTASQTISSLSNNTAYRVRVRAVNAVGDGAWAYGSGTPTSTGERPKSASWKGYSLTLSADRQPSERGDDVTVTLDLGKPAPPGFFATLEGLPAGTARYVLNGTKPNNMAPAKKNLDLSDPEERAAIERQAADWTMMAKAQGAGGNVRPASSAEIARGAKRGVVLGSGRARLQTHLRDWNGARTKTVKLRIFDDTAWDPDETIVLRAIGYGFGSPTVVRPTGTTGGHPWTGFGFSELHSNTLTLTIVDDESAGAADAPLEVGVLDALTYETGTGEGTNAHVTVWLNRPAKHDVTVAYATADGSARSDGTVGAGTLDYAAKSGTVTIPAGETRAEVTVAVFDDAVEDSGETFLVKLSNPSPSTVRLARAEATVTIRNDEVRLADLEVEGGPGAKGPWSALDIGAFSRDRTDYAVTVPYGTTHAHLRATPVNERAAALATGAGPELAAVRPGIWGKAVALEVGDNTLVVTATGPSGEVKTYRVTVTRKAWAPSSSADLRWLLVQGASNGAGPWTKLDIGTVEADTAEYAATVPHAMTVARIMATPMDEKATHRTGAGGELSAARAGFYSRGFPLAVGDNAFAVEVTAEDGAAKTYRVTVTREAAARKAVAVSLSAAPNPVDEGSAVSVTATLSEAVAGTVTIPLATTRDTSEAGDHGSLASITVPAGGTSATGTVSTNPDDDGDDETFTVALGSLPSGLTAGAASSVRVTIADSGSGQQQGLDPLTASFENVPPAHDGREPFAFDLRFSEALGSGGAAPSEASFRVRAGSVAGVERVSAGLWRVRVQPKNWKDVTVTLAPPSDCAATGAICAADGRALSNTPTAGIGGPVRIRVEGARAKEGRDKTLDFAVTLSRAAAHEVSVDYATADDTATAGRTTRRSPARWCSRRARRRRRYRFRCSTTRSTRAGK